MVAGMPLHIAAQNVAHVSEAVFFKLIAVFPAAVTAKNDDGDLAIHIAAANEAPDGVMLALIDADPSVCSTPDEGGELPLHTAAYNKASETVLRRMIDAFPNAPKCEDNYRNLPLHVAVQNRAAITVIQTLLGEYPEADVLDAANRVLVMVPDASRVAELDVSEFIFEAHRLGQGRPQQSARAARRAWASSAPLA